MAGRKRKAAMIVRMFDGDETEAQRVRRAMKGKRMRRRDRRGRVVVDNELTEGPRQATQAREESAQTVTVAPQLAVGTTLYSTDDTSYSAFQNVNQPGGASIVCGNIFLGLQGYCVVRVPLGELLGLARGATIETGLTNAAVTFRASGNWTAGGAINVNVMLDDSPRAGPLDSRLAWKPPGGFGPAWRRDRWGVFDVRLEDTGGTPFIDTGPGTFGGWGIRAITDKRDELATPFNVPAGPGWSVARAILDMRRFGNPGGSMEVAIQTNTTDGYGHDEPDGVDLGVSAAVLNSTIVATPGNGPITYAFAPDVVLPTGRYWAVIRPAVSYPVNGTDFVVWMQRRVFFGDGGSHRTINGVGFDQGNFPGHADVSLDTVPKQAGADIVWNPPARSVGQSVSTPDLSALVQEVCRNSGHETTSALCFTFRTVGETRTYRFAANDHPTLDPPGFACQFRRRNHRGGAP